MSGEFFTLESLATFAGMVAAVSLIVQFTKPFFKSSLQDWVIRPYTLFIALIVQSFVLYVRENFTVETVGLGIINSVLVALTSMGGYEVITDPAAKKRQPYR